MKQQEKYKSNRSDFKGRISKEKGGLSGEKKQKR